MIYFFFVLLTFNFGFTDSLSIPAKFHDFKLSRKPTNYFYSGCPLQSTLSLPFVQSKLGSNKKPINSNYIFPGIPKGCTETDSIFSGNLKDSSSDYFSKQVEDSIYFELRSGIHYMHQNEGAGPIVKSKLDTVVTDSGTYIFVKSDTTYVPGYFFPLDRLGLKDSALTSNGYHNTYFCLEAHTSFKYRKGLYFSIASDDDSWLFLNDSLIIDLGGRHSQKRASIKLDSLSYLENAKVDFDLFYCDRGNIALLNIETNIFSKQPATALLKYKEAPTSPTANIYLINGQIYPHKSANNWNRHDLIKKN